MNDLIYNYIISKLDKKFISSLHNNNHMEKVKKIIAKTAGKASTDSIVRELMKEECGQFLILAELSESEYNAIPASFWKLNSEDKLTLVKGWEFKSRNNKEQICDFIRFLKKTTNINFMVFILNRFFKAQYDKDIRFVSLDNLEETFDFESLSEQEKDLIYRNYRIYACDKKMTALLSIADLKHEYPVLYHYLKNEELVCLISKNVCKIRTLETSLYSSLHVSLSENTSDIYRIIEFVKSNIIKKGKIPKTMFNLILHLYIILGKHFDLNMCYAVAQTLSYKDNLVASIFTYLGINNNTAAIALRNIGETPKISFLKKILILRESSNKKTFAKFKMYLNELTKEKDEGIQKITRLVTYIGEHCSEAIWIKYFRLADISSFETEDFFCLFERNNYPLDLVGQFKSILAKLFDCETCGVKVTKNDFIYFSKNQKGIDKLNDDEIISYIKEFTSKNYNMKKDKLYLRIGDMLEINSFGIEKKINPIQVLKLFDFFQNKTIESKKQSDEMELDTPLFLLKTYLDLNGLSDCTKSLNDLRMYEVLLVFEGLEFVSKIKSGGLAKYLYSDSKISKFLTRKDSLGLTEKFIGKYEDNIINFIASENMNIVLAYFKTATNKTHNFALIIKAVLAGKYNDIKWDLHDLSTEINTRITTKMFQNWKENKISVYGNIKIEECDDFNSIMTIGEKPVHTCQSYINGAYSDCLLANFDSSKKILKIYKDGLQIGRAILRLTLYSKKSAIGDELRFKDVETRDKNKNENNNKIIFIEKLYSQLNSTELSQVCAEELVSFLSEKAKDIGSKLAFARTYDWVPELKSKQYNIMISESKNGNQYIDSMCGESNRRNKYNWEKVHCYSVE